MKSAQPALSKKHLSVALCALAALTLVALASGKVWLSPAEMLRGLFSSAGQGADTSLVWQLRAPRVCAALLMGAALALSGLMSQVTLRNPLASPDVLGVSAGAALGACVALIANAPALIVFLAAFATGLAVMLVVQRFGETIARVNGRDPVLMLILIGVSLGSLCAAGITIVKWWADPFGKAPSVSFWLAGGLSGVGWTQVVHLTLPLFVASVLGARLITRLPILELGDEVAATSGAHVASLRRSAVFVIAMVTAATVATGGMLGWIALIVPHLARALVPRVAHPWTLCAIVGAGMMLAVDTLCRSVADVELPPGVVLSILGVPGFLWVLLRGAEANGR